MVVSLGVPIFRFFTVVMCSYSRKRNTPYYSGINTV